MPFGFVIGALWPRPFVTLVNATPSCRHPITYLTNSDFTAIFSQSIRERQKSILRLVSSSVIDDQLWLLLSNLLTSSFWNAGADAAASKCAAGLVTDGSIIPGNSQEKPLLNVR